MLTVLRHSRPARERTVARASRPWAIMRETRMPRKTHHARDAHATVDPLERERPARQGCRSTIWPCNLLTSTFERPRRARSEGLAWHGRPARELSCARRACHQEPSGARASRPPRAHQARQYLTVVGSQPSSARDGRAPKVSRGTGVSPVDLHARDAHATNSPSPTREKYQFSALVQECSPS